MDVDDVAAISIAHAMQDNGECTILAIVQNTQPPKCAGVISVINHYYGRDDIPIGAYKGKDLSATSPYLSYVDELMSNFPSPIQNTSQVPDALDTYRSVLAKQPDHSVAISSIGILTNLEQLLKSPPDTHSTLSGYDLIVQKVKVLVVMGGKYPSSKTSPECNLCGCAHADPISSATASRASSYVVSNWPKSVEIIYNGFNVGLQVQSGAALSTCQNARNPIRAAFINYEGGINKSRFSWDPLTTLIAVRGVEAGSCTTSSSTGFNSVNAKHGTNQWMETSQHVNQSYLSLVDGVQAGKSIDALLCQSPKLKSNLLIPSSTSSFSMLEQCQQARTKTECAKLKACQYCSYPGYCTLVGPPCPTKPEPYPVNGYFYSQNTFEVFQLTSVNDTLINATNLNNTWKPTQISRATNILTAQFSNQKNKNFGNIERVPNVGYRIFWQGKVVSKNMFKNIREISVFQCLNTCLQFIPLFMTFFLK